MTNNFSDSAAIQAFQLQKIQELLAYLQEHSPFYKSLFASANIDINSIITLNDLQQLPVTTKKQMQEQNMDFLCVDKNKVIEYTATSGTLGKPVTIALTENDLERLAYNELLSFASMGASHNDIMQLMLTLDRQFMAGIAYYAGIRKLGAGMVRVGPGAPAQQWEVINRLQPTIIVAVPSFILKLIEYANDHSIDLKNTSVKKALCIGENTRNLDYSFNVLGQKITTQWPIQLFSTYASTEMQTAFTECSAGKGGHLNAELLIVELLDDNNQQVAAGEPGEVTITTLGVEGMPLLRYKTGDICQFDDSPCSCGRNSLRLSPVIGRKQQMIKLKGTTIYPPALFDLLNSMPEVKEYVTEVSLNDLGLDEVALYITPTELTETTDRSIKAILQGTLRVIPEIKYLPAEAIHRMQFPEGGRKALKFIDKR
ncbi:phenylacetate--CoA ligase [soil metagenome]